MPTNDERGIVSKSKLTALANKIKSAAGKSGLFTLDELAALDISGSGGIVLESKSIAQNGTYTPDAGKAWNEVTVNVEGSSQKSLIKIGEVEVESGSRIATIQVPEEYQLEQYFVVADNVVHTNSYTYVTPNGTGASGGVSIGYFAKRTTDNTIAPILWLKDSVTISGKSRGKNMYLMPDGGNTYLSVTVSAFNSISFVLYDSTATFTSGKYELWGYV